MAILNQPLKVSFTLQEQNCENSFLKFSPFWHLCTPGQQTEILFESVEDYKFAVSLIAIVAAFAGVRVVTFEIMSNHIHVILQGRREDCLEFFRAFKNKLSRYYVSKNRFVSLARFEANLIPISDLRQLRAEIAYTHRNGYLASGKYMPFSYPWGAGSLYFNPLAYRQVAVKFSEAPFREKRIICSGRVPDLPEGYLVGDGMILPQSFCDIALGESMFRDAHHYFLMISKNYEAYSAVASRLGDEVFLDDEEMFAVVVTNSRNLYNEARPSMLPPKDKLELARIMRKDYHASEGQIQRMLRLDRALVAELFGH